MSVEGENLPIENNSEKEDEEVARRRDWEVYDQLITAKFCELMLANQKYPTHKEIAEGCNVSTKTVERHLKDRDFKEFLGRFKAGSQMVLMNLFKQASTSPNPKWAQIWFEVVEGHNPNKININTNLMGPTVIFPGENIEE